MSQVFPQIEAQKSCGQQEEGLSGIPEDQYVRKMLLTSYRSSVNIEVSETADLLSKA